SAKAPESDPRCGASDPAAMDRPACDLLAVSQAGAGRTGPDACRRRVPAHGKRTEVSVPGTRALCARGSAVIAAVCGPHADRFPRQHGISTFRCRGVVWIRDQEWWIHRLCCRGPKGFVVLAYPAGRPASDLDRERCGRAILCRAVSECGGPDPLCQLGWQTTLAAKGTGPSDYREARGRGRDRTGIRR